jgi:hypothetical protein
MKWVNNCVHDGYAEFEDSRDIPCLFLANIVITSRGCNNVSKYVTISMTPQTLQEWRSGWGSPASHVIESPRRLWTPLEGFFLSHGYTLWIEQIWNDLDLRPSNLKTPRTPDGFAYRTMYNDNEAPSFGHVVSMPIVWYYSILI